MAVLKTKIDFTEGKIFFKIVRFILPIVATNLLQMLYNAADMIVVSLSTEKNAVGAIGTAGAFINLIINLFIGFSVGVNVAVSKYIGAKDREKTQKAVSMALFLALVTGGMGCVLGIALSRPILSAMGNSGFFLELAVRYTCICFLGVPFLALTNYLIAIFRAKGDSRTPFLVLSFAGLVNVGLNLFFVLGAGLSVEGVAIATAIANLLSFVVLFIKLQQDKDYTNFSFREWQFDKSIVKEILLVGLPSGIQSALFALSNMLIQSAIVKVNNLVVPSDIDYQAIINGNAAAANIEGFVHTAISAVAHGIITVTSQNIGAKKPERIKAITYNGFLLATIIGVIMSGAELLFKTQLLSLYGIVEGSDGSLEAIAMQAATSRMFFIGVPYFLCGLMEVTTSVLRGLGKSIVGMVISLVGVCLLRTVWLWTVFPLFLSLPSIFLCYPITWALTAIVGFILVCVLVKKELQKAGKQ